MINQLYSLVPEDANSLETVPLAMAFKPNMSCYIIKTITVKRLNKESYEKTRGVYAYKEDVIRSQSLAAVHYNPENILKRMNFRWVIENEEPVDSNTPAASEEAS